MYRNLIKLRTGFLTAQCTQSLNFVSGSREMSSKKPPVVTFVKDINIDEFARNRDAAEPDGTVTFHKKNEASITEADSKAQVTENDDAVMEKISLTAEKVEEENKETKIEQT